jgi:hypothetical protein
MSGEPIKAGDLCKVINGLQGQASPNIGLVVEVLAYVGDHSKLGRIWRCKAEYAEKALPGADVPGRPSLQGAADFAQSWLKKIPPPGQNIGITTTTDNEVTA